VVLLPTVTLVQRKPELRVVGSFRQPRIWVADLPGPAADAAIAGSPPLLLSFSDGGELLLRSARPVLVNNASLTAAEIRSGDQLAFDDSIVEVVLDGRGPSRRLREVTVVQVAPEREAPRVFRQTSIRIGKRPDNDIFVVSPLLSALHAVLYWGDDALYLRDLGSMNGTSLGGARVDHTRAYALQSGDSVGIAGRFTLEVAIEPPS
jgi:hypothetical protein